MNQNFHNLPLVLCIADGWGIAPPSRGNAISQAKLPFFDMMTRNYQTFALAAAGEAVGLPWGEPGNSEVGHQNLGAGKIVYQEVLRINKSIENETFFENKVLQGAVAHAKQHNSNFHIIGLLSDGGVHSHQDHIYASLELAARAKLKNVFVHVILDGRDTTYDSGLGYVTRLEKIMKRINVGRIATVSGRFYAMDRDNHWDRIEKAYWAMVKGESEKKAASAEEAIQQSYEAKVYDEEFIPTVITKDGKDPVATIQPGDSVMFTNYRPDRARELTTAFTLPTFTKFQRSAMTNLYFATMTQYQSDIPVQVAFPKDSVAYPLARVWSEQGLRQYHVAETEKYAHVTYFFNGGSDTVYEGQDNEIVASKGSVSYADQPDMSAREITTKILDVLSKKSHDIIVANYANADMVGHTGNLQATMKGLAVLDEQLKKVATAVLKQGGVMVMTADHGNAEEMVNWDDGHIIKEHSAHPVPCILVGEPFKFGTPKPDTFTLDSLQVSGVLSDVAPTLLAINGITQPQEMTARSLIQ